MRNISLLFFGLSLFNAPLANAMTIDELLGCYKIDGTTGSEFRIESDPTGEVILSSPQAVIKLENSPSNWTPVGETSIQFFSRKTIVESFRGFLSKYAVLTWDQNRNLVVNYLEALYSNNGPAVREGRMNVVLMPKTCAE